MYANPYKYDLKGKTALITGAARRIGRAISVALAQKGVNVVAHYHSSENEVVELKKELELFGVKCWPLKADLSVRSELESLITKAFQAAGAVDVLVNNASIFNQELFKDLSLESINKNIALNAWTPYLLSRDLVAAASSGKIINILDTRIKGRDKRHAAYHLSKSMLYELTMISASDFAPDFTVNAVAPGLILPPPGEDESSLEKLAGKLPLRRHGDPRQVADAVIFLLESNFITGQVIFVDGGRHLRYS